MTHEHLGRVGGYIVNPQAQFTRPGNTTQYASGDLIANSTTASEISAMVFSDAARVPGGSFLIRRARLYKNDDDVASAQFRLHLFDADPTDTDPSNGDNGAIQLTGCIDNHLGSIDLDINVSPDIHTDGNWASGVPLQGSEISVKLGSGRDIYGLLEARSTYTPASGEVFTVVLEVLQD